MATQTDDSVPVLWQLEISHYSEKIRWALEHKRVDHVRRSSLPGMHMAAALGLTRGASYTLPILQLDGRTIVDSTAIIAALEQRYPERPLYPSDPDLRRRALELEDFFDEQLGPHVRLMAFNELIADPAVLRETASQAVPGPLGKMKPVVGAYARAYTSLRFGANDDEGAAAARAKVLAALDRLDAELESGGGPYLVGDELSVADITAASLFYPLVGPEGSPVTAADPTPASLVELRAELSQRPGYKWVQDTYRRRLSAN